LIKPGTNPHTFSPTIGDVKRLTTADIVFANGLELEPYLESYKNIIFLSDFLPKEILLKDAHDSHEKDEEHDEEHEHGEFNPHIWVSPQLVRDHIIPQIVKVLLEKDPKNRESFEKNAKKLINSLNDVVNRFDQLLSSYKNAVLVITHPSIVYLTVPYGIETLALEEGHGKEPSAKRLMEIIEEARSKKLVGIFAEMQFNEKLLGPIAKELKREIVVLDPLGVNVKNSVDYYENLLGAFQKATGVK
ncbi:MAG: metal ABC transporter substrate-binding protein, partial [Candidatus Hadarchaeales archaeon]